MKKLFASIAILALVTTGASAQERAFNSGDLVWNLGYGIVGGVYDNSNNFYTTVVNPISISGEFGVLGFGAFTVGVGAYLSGNYADYKLPVIGDKIYLGSIVAAGRVALHFNLGRFLDLGVGANIGYNIWIMRADKNVPSNLLPEDKSEFAWAPYATVRLMFTKSFGIFGEAGFGNIAKTQDNNGDTKNTEATFVNVGLSFNW